jgi:hypothetical protein
MGVGSQGYEIADQVARLGSGRPFIGIKPASDISVWIAKRAAGTGQAENKNTRSP